MLRLVNRPYCEQIVCASMTDGNQFWKPMCYDCFQPLKWITAGGRWVAQHVLEASPKFLPRKRMQLRLIAAGLEDDSAHICSMRQVYDFVQKYCITKGIASTTQRRD